MSRPRVEELHESNRYSTSPNLSTLWLRAGRRSPSRSILPRRATPPFARELPLRLGGHDRNSPRRHMGLDRHGR